MGLSINTSEYSKSKKVKIDGVDFSVRPMSSSESLAIMSVSRDMKKITSTDNADDIDKISDSMSVVYKIYYGLFDKPKKAEELLGNLPIEDLFNIYSEIMKEG